MHRRLIKTSAPAWANEALVWACARYQVSLPGLTWNQNPDKVRGHAGRAYPKAERVMVVEAEDMDYNRGSLLHEAAHHIAAQKGMGVGHGKRFYDICWDLMLADGVALDKVVAVEVCYMPSAWARLEATGVALDDYLRAVAQRATQERKRRQAEEAVDKAARKLATKPQAGDEDEDYRTYRRLLMRWKRLDDAIQAKDGGAFPQQLAAGAGLIGGQPGIVGGQQVV